MIKLIVGTKGSGKTKAMVDMINNATQTTTGNVVVIEKCMNLTYHIDYKARLIDMDEYKISGYDMLYGFISGVLAGNYDITRVFIDGLYKITGEKDPIRCFFVNDPQDFVQNIFLIFDHGKLIDTFSQVKV